MRNTKLSVLIGILKVLDKHRVDWSTASQNTMLKHLKKYHGIRIGIRMLNYHLADLRRMGFIQTYPGHKRRPDGTFLYSTSKNGINLAGLAYLVKMGVTAARKRLFKLRDRYHPGRTIKQILTSQTTELDPPPKEAKYNPFKDKDFRKKQGLKPDFDELLQPV